MKARMVFFKGVCLICILTLFNLPFQAIAQPAQPTSDAMQAFLDAQRDGKSAPDSYIWFPIGCLLGVIGVAFAGISTPPVPAEKLLGKSPEYVAYYTSTYQEVAKQEQLKEASLGCLFGTCLWVGAYAYVLSQNPNSFRY